MTVSLHTFRDEYPEFRNTADTEVTRKLARAKNRVRSNIWGDLTDEGVGLLTAHLLALAPAGQNARLDPKTMTMYMPEYKKLQRVVTFGLRVAT